MSQQKKKLMTLPKIGLSLVKLCSYYTHTVTKFTVTRGPFSPPPGLLHPRKSPVQTSRVKTVTVSCKRLVNKKLFLPCMRLPYNSRECFVTSCSLLRLRAYNSLQNQTPFLSLGFRPPDEKNELVFFRMGA